MTEQHQFRSLTSADQVETEQVVTGFTGLRTESNKKGAAQFGASHFPGLVHVRTCAAGLMTNGTLCPLSLSAPPPLPVCPVELPDPTEDRKYSP